MTPTITAALISSKQYLPLTNKLKKPVAEEMHRERINIKSLSWTKNSRKDHEGYSRCVQEAVVFLSQCGVQTPSQRRLLSHFLTMQPSMEKSTSVLQISFPLCHISSKEETPAPAVLWRPC
ncbi:hypothetical protein MHYP_G00077150 [Metynnis hypsauchen]